MDDVESRLRLRCEEMGGHSRGDHAALYPAPLLHGLGLDSLSAVLQDGLLPREALRLPPLPAADLLNLGNRIYLSAAVPYPDREVFLIFAEPAGGLGEGTLGDTGLRCKRARNSEPLRGELKLWFEAWTFCSPHWRTLLCHAASASYPDYLTYVRTATFGAHTVEVRLHERLPAQPPCLLAVVHPVGLALEQREQLQLLKDRGVAIVGVDAGRDHARSRALGYVEGYLEARWKR